MYLVVEFRKSCCKSRAVGCRACVWHASIWRAFFEKSSHDQLFTSLCASVCVWWSCKLSERVKSNHARCKMGAIASVLQWHCAVCGLINPTEQLKCIRCASHRPLVTNVNKELSGETFARSNCTVIRRVRSNNTRTSSIRG